MNYLKPKVLHGAGVKTLKPEAKLESKNQTSRNFVESKEIHLQKLFFLKIFISKSTPDPIF